jgi:hypothetical protein
LKNNGKNLNYHSFWDGSLKRWRKGWTCEKYFDRMEKLTPSQAKRVTKGDAYKWTQQTADTARECFKLTPANSDIAKFTKEQRAAIHRKADRQMQLAAYRLAAVLNDIFKE